MHSSAGFVPVGRPELDRVVWNSFDGDGSLDLMTRRSIASHSAAAGGPVAPRFVPGSRGRADRTIDGRGVLRLCRSLRPAVRRGGRYLHAVSIEETGDRRFPQQFGAQPRPGARLPGCRDLSAGGGGGFPSPPPSARRAPWLPDAARLGSGDVRRGSSRRRFVVPAQGGFATASEYRSAQADGFDTAARTRGVRRSGFTSSSEFRSRQAKGFSDRSAYQRAEADALRRTPRGDGPPLRCRRVPSPQPADPEPSRDRGEAAT